MSMISETCNNERVHSVDLFYYLRYFI